MSFSIKTFFATLMASICSSPLLAFNVKTETFFSPSVNLQLKYTVVLPNRYSKDDSTKYPVIYLLHGFTGDHQSWLGIIHFHKRLANKYKCILVLPDGGNSWYVNWTGQTDGKQHNWSDMIVKDLIPDAEKKYKTIGTKASRAIGGFSMGGFGALSIGLRNLDLFGTIFSSSGAVNFCKNIKANFANKDGYGNNAEKWVRSEKNVNCDGFRTFDERTPKGQVFKNIEDADAFDPYTLLANADSSKLPFIHIDCGTEDYFTKDNAELNEVMKTKVTQYNYYITKGEHTGEYTKKVIAKTFKTLNRSGLFKR
jgi:putative tributyrin esterase